MQEPCEHLRWQSGFGKRQHYKMPVKGGWQPVHPLLADTDPAGFLMWLADTKELPQPSRSCPCRAA